MVACFVLSGVSLSCARVFALWPLARDLHAPAGLLPCRREQKPRANPPVRSRLADLTTFACPSHHSSCFRSPPVSLVGLLTCLYLAAPGMASLPPFRSLRWHSFWTVILWLSTTARFGALPVHPVLVNNGPLARARVAAVQSRVAALVVSGPRAPPLTSAFSSLP